MARAEGRGLVQMIVEFCRYARESGLAIGVKESLDALQAAREIGIADRETLKSALRAVLCSSKADWDIFDDVFDTYWETFRGSEDLGPQQRKSGRKQTNASHQQARPESFSSALLGQTDSASVEGEGKAVLGASAHERLKKADFSELSQTDLAELEQLSLRLLQRMSLRLSRRYKMIAARGRVDLRRTIRRSIPRGGEPIDLSFRKRKLQQLKLVILLDISGSMNPYSLFFVRFAYALQKHFKRVDTFVFSTQLTEITSALRTGQLPDAMRALAEQAAGWSAGTKIGDSLHELNMEHSRRLLSRDTVFMVLSDGWDTGDPGVLTMEISAIKRRVRKLIWLNPLLGMANYEPVTQGMSAALPFVDVFAPAHNLESLLELERHLSRA